MKKILPIILTVLMFSVFYCSNETGEINRQEDSSAGVRFVDLSIPDALAKAGTENKIVLIDFFSPT
jgi:hypothetical protein